MQVTTYKENKRLEGGTKTNQIDQGEQEAAPLTF
jgi:hypothetical protein